MEDGKRFKPYMESLGGTAKAFFETRFFRPGFESYQNPDSLTSRGSVIQSGA